MFPIILLILVAISNSLNGASSATELVGKLKDAKTKDVFAQMIFELGRLEKSISQETRADVLIVQQLLQSSQNQIASMLKAAEATPVVSSASTAPSASAASKVPPEFARLRVLPSRLNALWKTVEQNLLEAFRPYVEQPKMCTKAIERIVGLSKQPNVEQTMREYCNVSLPTIHELLEAAFPPNLATEVTAALNDVEKAIAAVMLENPQKFNEYRNTQRGEEYEWPHSPEMQTEWVQAGFQRMPMMIKLDGMKCPTCNREVSSIFSWMRPQYYHDWTKHPASFLDQAIAANPRLARIEYGQQIPQITANKGTDAYAAQERTLLNYLLCHIDAHIMGNARFTTDGKYAGGLDNLESTWYGLRGTRGQLWGWIRMSYWLENREKYMKKEFAKELTEANTSIFGS